MTQEEKAKAYDEALETARKINSGEGVAAPPDWTICEVIFPELKDSEDEKIRKALIALLDFGLEDGSAIAPGFNETKEQALAWLEKQGDKPQGKTALEAIEEEKVDNANKVKPKFKVGDWVVNNTTLNVCHILKIEHGQYICDDCSFPITKENEYHLWTIQDAKDGDILASRHEQPFIYNGNYDYFYVGAHCGIDCFGNAFVTNESDRDWTCNKHIHPATKEQRELLFATMKKAGYEWDADKKKLKKIEQKLVWSEEDDKMLDSIIFDFGLGRISTGSQDLWLKSIKERIGG